MPAPTTATAPIDAASTNAVFDTLIKGGHVIDPATGLDAILDIGVNDGVITAIGPDLPTEQADHIIGADGKVVIAGMIDTHGHIYEHVTGSFGLNPDMVGVHSAVTTIIDQGGPSCMTLGGYRHYITEQSKTRALCFISCYLVGGLEGHLYPDLYGPHGVNPEHTIRVAKDNLDLVRGIKAHAEIGGQSRWGLDVIRIGKEISRATDLPLYIHLGQLWSSVEEGPVPNPDDLIRDLVPIMDEGDILAHPFTRHPGGFVSEHGDVHPIVFEAMARGVRCDIGHGSHFSFEVAKKVLDTGLRPFTLGADLHGYNVKVPTVKTDQSVREANPFFGIAPFNLTVAMSELLALGLTLSEVIAMVTQNPAEMLGLSDTLGSLQVGREADISVLSIESGKFKLFDNSGVEVITDKLVRPVMCLRAGEHFEADSPLIPPAFAA